MKPSFLKRLLSDIFFVAKRDKKWWLLPLVLVLILVGIVSALSVLAGPLAPFIYPFL